MALVGHRRIPQINCHHERWWQVLFVGISDSWQDWIYSGAHCTSRDSGLFGSVEHMNQVVVILCAEGAGLSFPLLVAGCHALQTWGHALKDSVKMMADYRLAVPASWPCRESALQVWPYYPHSSLSVWLPKKVSSLYDLDLPIGSVRLPPFSFFCSLLCLESCRCSILHCEVIWCK